MDFATRTAWPTSMRVARWAVTLLLIGILTACGGGGDGGGPTAAPEVTIPPEVITPPPETVVAIQTESAAELATASANELATAAQGSAVDPCAMVNQAEMEAILGESLLAAPARDPGMPLVCTYPLEEYDVHLFVANSADLAAYGMAADAATSFTAQSEQASNAEGFQEVAGLGDDAFQTMGALVVRNGDFLISVDSASTAQLIAIAEQAIKRLP